MRTEKKVTVIATLESGVRIALTTSEQLSDFFIEHPSATLEFLEVSSGKK